MELSISSLANNHLLRATAHVGHSTFDRTGFPHVGQTGFVKGFLLPVAGLADIICNCF